jgi:hypothetical protein
MRGLRRGNGLDLDHEVGAIKLRHFDQCHRGLGTFTGGGPKPVDPFGFSVPA